MKRTLIVSIVLAFAFVTAGCGGASSEKREGVGMSGKSNSGKSNEGKDAKKNGQGKSNSGKSNEGKSGKSNDQGGPDATAPTTPPTP